MCCLKVQRTLLMALASFLVTVFGAFVVRASGGGGGGDSGDSGTSSGGGGTVILFPGAQTSPFLLDLLTVDSSLSNKMHTSPALTWGQRKQIQNQPEVGDLLPMDGRAFRLAYAKLEAWVAAYSQVHNSVSALSKNQIRSWGMMRLIEDALGGMPFLRTTRAFGVVYRFYLAPSLLSQTPAPNLWTAILYEPYYGAIISAPVWDSLDPETQAGLLIHESIRQIQGAYGHSEIQDQDLEQWTAQIMMVSPSASVDFSAGLSNSLKAQCEVRSSSEMDNGTVDQKDALAVSQFNQEVQTAIDSGQREQAAGIKSGNKATDKLKSFLDQLTAQGVLKPQSPTAPAGTSVSSSAVSTAPQPVIPLGVVKPSDESQPDDSREVRDQVRLQGTLMYCDPTTVWATSGKCRCEAGSEMAALAYLPFVSSDDPNGAVGFGDSFVQARSAQVAKCLVFRMNQMLSLKNLQNTPTHLICQNLGDFVDATYDLCFDLPRSCSCEE